MELPGNTLGNVNSNGAATNLDAIGEVTVMLNNYQAEYGRNGGASINVVTKSGTKTFHGGAYCISGHEMFNANDFFSNQNGLAKSIYRYNTIGGTRGRASVYSAEISTATGTSCFSSIPRSIGTVGPPAFVTGHSAHRD